MQHQPIKAGPLTDPERASLTDAERTFLAGVAQMEPEARDMFLTAFGLAVRAQTDEEAEQHLQGFRAWLANHSGEGANA